MAYPRRKVTDEMRRVITENTNKVAAELLGISKSTVWAICRDEGIRSKQEINADGSPRGERRSAIFDMWIADASIAEICKTLDLRASGVCSVLGIPTPSGIALYLSRAACKRLDEMTPAGVLRDEYVAEIIDSFVAFKQPEWRK
jgi:hypothetical protein